MDLDLHLIWYHFYHLAIAFALAFPIALQREYRADVSGLRTFPLVAVAACAFMLVGMDVYSGSDAEARVMYGIITGIGFIGGGAIVKHNGHGGGTATAAGIWNMGAIGVSVAYSRYEIALVLSVISFLIFHFSEPLKKSRAKLRNDESRN